MLAEAEEADGTTDAYTFAWTHPSFPHPTVVNAATSSQLTVAGSGSHTVEVTNTVTGCILSASDAIPYNPDVPTLNFISLVDDRFCVAGNGQIEVEAQPDTASYRYDWFTGGAQIGGEINPTILNLDAASYQAVAFRESNFCTSDTLTIDIDDISTDPVINFSDMVAQTSCDSLSPTGLTGELLATTLEADGTIDTYTFAWTHPSFPHPTQSDVANTSQLTVAGSGSHTVQVTNTVTGCVLSASDAIDYTPDLPLVDLVALADDSYCVNGDGSIELDASPNTTTYTYQWYAGSISAGNLIAGETTNTISDLDAGTYFSIARRDDNFCESEQIQVDVADISADPVASLLDILAQTSCDSLSPTGLTGEMFALAGEQSGNADIYTFNWTFPGLPNPSIATTDSSNYLTIALQGDYDLLLSNDVTGCTVTASANIPYQPANPGISLVSITDDRYCTNGDGAIEVTATPGATTHTYTWYTPSVGAGNVIAGETTSIISNRVAGEYFAVAMRDDNFCTSSPLQAEIDDIASDPVLYLTNLVNNSSCDPANPNGELLATALEADSTADAYTFAWTFLRTPNPTQVDAANTSQLTGAIDTTYSVLVNNTVTGCTIDGADYIDYTPDNPVLAFLSSIDDSFCVDGDGEIQVTATPGITTYTYTWYNDTINPINVILGETASAITDLDAGDYMVIAQRDDNLCESEPLTVTIDDISMDPVVRFSGLLPQTSCDSLSPVGLTGELIASAEEQDASTDSYTFVWTFPSSPDPAVVNTATSSALTAAVQGTYTVDVTNDLTGCVISGTREIPLELTLPTIDLIQLINDEFCVGGNGLVEVAGNPAIAAGYTYQWYAGSIVPGSELATTGSTLSNLADNSYFVSAIRNDNFCASEYYQADVLDISADPVLSFDNPIPQSACDLASPVGANGGITATVVETDGSTSIYNYSWTFPGTAPTVTNAGNTSQLSDAEAGLYNVLVTNAISNCTVAGNFTIEEDFPDIVIPSAGLTITDQFTCIPPDGAAEITTLREDGVDIAWNGTNYSFEWYEADATTLIESGTNPFDEQFAGDYVVVVVNNGTNCTSLPIEFTIDDISTPPVVDVTEIRAQSSCDPTIPNGAIRVSGDGQLDDNPNYSWRWYAGSDTTGTVISTQSIVTGLQQGLYTVAVRNEVTGCTTEASNNLGEQIILPQVTASAVPLTSCIADNGSILATVSNPATGGVYRFEWYTSTDTTNTPIFIGQNPGGLSVGSYVVVAIEEAVNFCRSEVFDVTVRDGRQFPQVVITEDAPLTNCDPAIPNGQFTATTNGSVADYTFEWYIGTQPFDSVLHTGNTITGLTNTTYSVVITNNVSGCSNFGSEDMSIDLPTVPVPDAEVLNHLTNCVTPDGLVSATVNGVISQHIFDWYDGTSVTSSPDFADDNIYGGLDFGFYTVTATNRNNGCVSEPLTIEVLDQRAFPQFALEITPEQCERMNGGALLASTADQIQFREILWSTGETGPLLENLVAGIYSVTVTATNDCVTEQEFEIPIDIFEFNGVSINGDGQNDIFEVACISNFPNNNIKIFNRAGQLVYEADGYNNSDIVFDGTSNRGISLMGTALPDGTYFYIIDKRDGSKPITGFLEILR